MENPAMNIKSRIILNDSNAMPLFGLGTSAKYGSRGPEEATKEALENGYRLIDTAHRYGTEEDIGKGIKSSNIKREDIFVVTKLWDTHGYSSCIKQFKSALSRLNMPYVDLYLIHHPFGGKVVECYKAMLDLKKEGLVRSVGVSNFGISHLEGLKKAGLPLPAVNQIELNPFWRQEQLVQYCKKNKIAVMGYCPLARGSQNDDQALDIIAQRYNKSVAQVLIKWSLQMGYITIPKSFNKERIVENSEVFHWSLSEKDMEILNSMPSHQSTYWDPYPTESAWEG